MTKRINGTFALIGLCIAALAIASLMNVHERNMIDKRVTELEAKIFLPQTNVVKFVTQLF